MEKIEEQIAFNREACNKDARHKQKWLQEFDTRLIDVENWKNSNLMLEF